MPRFNELVNWMAGYPSTSELLANPERMKYKPAVLRFVRQWKREQRGHRRSPEAVTALLTGLAEIYRKPVQVAVRDSALGEHYNVESGTIVLVPKRNGNLSIVTALHEFAHHIFGLDEVKAARWSVHLFRRTFPRTFERARFEGHMMRIDPRVEAPQRAVRVNEHEN